MPTNLAEALSERISGVSKRKAASDGTLGEHSLSENLRGWVSTVHVKSPSGGARQLVERRSNTRIARVTWGMPYQSEHKRGDSEIDV